MDRHRILIYQTVAAIILGLTSLGIFAKGADVESLRTEMYQHFAQKEDVSARLDTLDAKIDDIKRILIEERRK